MMKLIVILSACLFCTALFGAEIETWLGDFSKRKFDRYVVLIGTIRQVDYKHYSPAYSDVNHVKISSEDILGSFPKSSGEKNFSCDVVSSTEMIAPFEESALDNTRNISTGEKVLVYLGITGHKCQVVHLSKIKNSKIEFPTWKSRPATSIDVGEGIGIWKDAFQSSFTVEK